MTALFVLLLAAFVAFFVLILVEMNKRNTANKRKPK